MFIFFPKSIIDPCQAESMPIYLLYFSATGQNRIRSLDESQQYNDVRVSDKTVALSHNWNKTIIVCRERRNDLPH